MSLIAELEARVNNADLNQLTPADVDAAQAIIDIASYDLFGRWAHTADTIVFAAVATTPSRRIRQALIATWTAYYAADSVRLSRKATAFHRAHRPDYDTALRASGIPAQVVRVAATTLSASYSVTLGSIAWRSARRRGWIARTLAAVLAVQAARRGVRIAGTRGRARQLIAAAASEPWFVEAALRHQITAATAS